MTKKKALVYQNATQAGKFQILYELVELADWHHDYARAALHDALKLKATKPHPTACRSMTPS